MDLSIVIPVYNEATKIGRDIREAAAFLTIHGLSGEILVADDGSTDDTALLAERSLPPSPIILKVLRLPRHTGKGAAVQTGMLQSTGNVVLFTDSGQCVPFTAALPAIQRITQGHCHLALGSRRLSASRILRSQTPLRRICSRMTSTCIQCLLASLRPLTDTQCGFKVFHGDTARRLFAQCQTTGFMFDVEILVRAQQAKLIIEEFPITWTCDRDSRLSPLRAWYPVLRDLWHIRKLTRKPPLP